MNGRVMPVSGRSRTIPPMMKKAWKPMMMVRPVATSLANSDRAVWAMCRPAPTSSRKATTTMVDPSRPISSPMTAKMKSVLELVTR